MRTITQTQPHTFTEALLKLQNGECLGITTKGNTSHLIAHRPPFMSHSTDFTLVWSHTQCADAMIRANQYLGEWFLVVADHRDLKVES